LDRAVLFYTRILNMDLVERVGSTFVFLSGSDSHHDVALQKVSGTAPQLPPEATGVDHVAFELSGKAEFAQAHRVASEAGVPVRAVDNGITWAMYFDDPDGNHLELFCDNRASPDGRALWEGRVRDLSVEEIRAALPD
jgi:catechol-2,3-dioxygenase